ncbi:hypothetical protein GCM10027589_56740 [Actinocorallia lasiicapitis]
MLRHGPALGVASLGVAVVGVWALYQNSDPGLYPQISANAPFVGTAAYGYANGTAGLAAPAATRIGGHSASEVSQAYTAARGLVERAALTSATFADKPTAAPLAIRISPDSAELANKTIKVTGGMTARPAANGLNVDLDYTIVYAVQKPKAPGRITRLTAHLTATTLHSPGKAPVVVRQAVTGTPATCADGVLLADFETVDLTPVACTTGGEA